MPSVSSKRKERTKVKAGPKLRLANRHCDVKFAPGDHNFICTCAHSTFDRSPAGIHFKQRERLNFTDWGNKTVPLLIGEKR